MSAGLQVPELQALMEKWSQAELAMAKVHLPREA